MSRRRPNHTPPSTLRRSDSAERLDQPHHPAGTTESERYLSRLARRAFLSLWSYSNVYTDEGRQGSGDGKELCDLLVVFGDDVLIFSDKDCQFPSHPDIKVSWSRWYKRAIQKSAKQLAGAEAWLARFPHRVYLDSQCKKPFPIELPAPSQRRIHLIAVTRGSAASAEAYWGGGSSSSLMIDTSLDPSNHLESPFRVGWVLRNRRFVHVFDETTLDIVLEELDTISDFVSYLTKKEERLSEPGTDYLIPGEEELIANYFLHRDRHTGEHYFPEPSPGALVVLREGDWCRLKNSKGYADWSREKEVSYYWDELIEFQNSHIISGTATTLYRKESSSIYERVMRTMAQEDRVTRLPLGESVFRARVVAEKGKRFVRTVVLTGEKRRGYIVMSLPRPLGYSYSQYQELRREQLLLSCDRCKLHVPDLREVVGIAFEPARAKTLSVDYMLVDFGDKILDPEFEREIQERLIEADMWDPGALATIPSTAVRTPTE